MLKARKIWANRPEPLQDSSPLRRTTKLLARAIVAERMEGTSFMQTLPPPGTQVTTKRKPGRHGPSIRSLPRRRLRGAGSIRGLPPLSWKMKNHVLIFLDHKGNERFFLRFNGTPTELQIWLERLNARSKTDTQWGSIEWEDAS